uniref:Mitochondrial import inner membrane translocase subunit TIM22 n=1 Tax=Alexandrium catenella TaxID=2925 RepID=A0A7S1MNT9_ALECA|mmetsp:Transcript_2928/g.7922  ORF Transcript_2928/g.7922 Transcript_2928/m.7922 type:complete len:175 (+) Transcript_2928:97-621(+)
MWSESFNAAQHAVDPLNPFVSERYRFLNYKPPLPPEMQQSLDVERIMSGCTAHAALGGIGGSVMGLLMGGFFHAMQPMNVDTSLSTWQQLRLSYKGFGTACTRMSRNFAKVGVVYAGVECFLERERATKDIPNAMYAGCATGGVLAFQAGPQAMALGCAGFAAFSMVIELVMGH